MSRGQEKKSRVAAVERVRGSGTRDDAEKMGKGQMSQGLLFHLQILVLKIDRKPFNCIEHE